MPPVVLVKQACFVFVSAYLSDNQSKSILQSLAIHSSIGNADPQNIQSVCGIASHGISGCLLLPGKDGNLLVSS